MLEWVKYEHNNNKIEWLNITKPSNVFGAGLVVCKSEQYMFHIYVGQHMVVIVPNQGTYIAHCMSFKI